MFAGALSRNHSPNTQNPWNVLWYADEVQPGNVLRPDRGRSFLAVYWGVKEAPDFFRSRGLWWVTLMYVPLNLVKSIRGGLSALYVKIMECFWGGELNMQRLGI